jgi:mRNA interferase RelE/StbE
MTYRIEFKPLAIKDLDGLAKDDAMRILDKTQTLQADLSGDVKRLTNHTPEFRLRVGDYRVLFDVEGDKITVRRVKHRKDAYR